MPLLSKMHIAIVSQRCFSMTLHITYLGNDNIVTMKEPAHAILVLYLFSSSEGSGESARIHKLWMQMMPLIKF